MTKGSLYDIARPRPRGTPPILKGARAHTWHLATMKSQRSADSAPATRYVAGSGNSPFGRSAPRGCAAVAGANAARASKVATSGGEDRRSFFRHQLSRLGYIRVPALAPPSGRRTSRRRATPDGSGGCAPGRRARPGPDRQADKPRHTAHSGGEQVGDVGAGPPVCNGLEETSGPAPAPAPPPPPPPPPPPRFLLLAPF